MPSSSLLNNKVTLPNSNSDFKQRFFPPFRNLPDYDGINEVYQTDPYRSGVVTNRIHWCFVGEIIADASIVRPVFHVQDRVGEKTIVALYLDNDATGYDASKFVVGNTICIMYAFKKTFLDGSEGIRVEDIETIQGGPCPAAFGLYLLCSITIFIAKVDGSWRVCCRWTHNL